jgi:hypothetical protein
MKKSLHYIINSNYIFTNSMSASRTEKRVNKSPKNNSFKRTIPKKNGTIYFAKQTDLFQLNTKLSNMSDEERLRWERKNFVL